MGLQPFLAIRSSGYRFARESAGTSCCTMYHHILLTSLLRERWTANRLSLIAVWYGLTIVMGTWISTCTRPVAAPDGSPRTLLTRPILPVQGILSYGRIDR